MTDLPINFYPLKDIFLNKNKLLILDIFKLTLVYLDTSLCISCGKYSLMDVNL